MGRRKAKLRTRSKSVTLERASSQDVDEVDQETHEASTQATMEDKLADFDEMKEKLAGFDEMKEKLSQLKKWSKEWLGCFNKCNTFLPNAISYVMSLVLCAQDSGGGKLAMRGRSIEGVGRSIRVLHDKWIPNYPTNQVLHPPLEAEEDWRVSELMDWDGHGWDRGLIAGKFHRKDAMAILRIPLSRRTIPDLLV
ncbi:hypothetical protein SO802_018224 [Lithocarpus litseifolius]|uniref:Uncharacterized protein n=1 Tax=Lithocarpus litseifolius TaxID=425828 RepID=A0AAW2CLT6_9ROSI